MLVVGVRPHLAARAVGDRVRLAAVVGVGVGDDHEPHVLDLQADLVERALEVAHRARLVGAGVDEHDPVAGRDRPRVAVRDARPRQREPQPPEAGEHALAAPHLPRSGRLAHGAGRYCPGMATSTQTSAPKAVMSAYFEALAEQDLDAIAAAWAPDGVMHGAGDVEADGAGRRARLLGGVLRRHARLPLRGPGHRRRRRSGRRPLGGQGHVRRARRRSRASSRPSRGSTSPGSTSSTCATARSCASTPTPTAPPSPARSGCCRRSGSTAEQRMTRAFNGQAKLKRRALSQRAGARSPRASGSCAAASRRSR